jgi:hypothetical protein
MLINAVLTDPIKRTLPLVTPHLKVDPMSSNQEGTNHVVHDIILLTFTKQSKSYLGTYTNVHDDDIMRHEAEEDISRHREIIREEQRVIATSSRILNSLIPVAKFLHLLLGSQIYETP